MATAIIPVGLFLSLTMAISAFIVTAQQEEDMNLNWMKLDWLLGSRPKLTRPDAKSLCLMEIETSRENLKARIATAKAQKKAWVPMWEQLRDLTNEEDLLRSEDRWEAERKARLERRTMVDKRWDVRRVSALEFFEGKK